MRYAILILLIALTSCQVPEVITVAYDDLQMEFDRGHCEATNYFSTFEAQYGIPPLTSDWSIFHFLDSFRIPQVWIETGEPVNYEDEIGSKRASHFVQCAEFDYSRFTSYHFGVIQAMKDWR